MTLFLLLICSPLLYGIIILFFKKNIYRFLRKSVEGFSLFHTTITFIFSIFIYQIPSINLLAKFSGNNIYKVIFLNDLGINLSFCDDKLSTLMMLLTSFLFTISIFSAKYFIHKNRKLFYFLILFLETILLAIFTTTDMFVFFTLWEIELIPLYFLISLWGNNHSEKSAFKFVLYMFTGSLFLLLGIILTYYFNYISTGNLSADMLSINMNNTGIIPQIFISILFLLGFVVKIPLVPFHRWLCEVHSNSATPVSIILAGILLKLGIYGIIRFNLGLFPVGFVCISPFSGFLGMISVIYGAILAYNQTNIKKIIACSSISQMGIIVLGLFSFTKSGYIGAIYHCISHGIVAAGLFLIAGIVLNKFKTNELDKLSGLACVSQPLYYFIIFIGFACAGLPMLSGFIGEFLSIYGSINSHIIYYKIFAIISVVIILLSILYLLKIIHSVFYGYNTILKVPAFFTKRLYILLGIISFLILLLGIYPNFLINFIK